MARYRTDGTLDTSFGGDGRVVTIFGEEDCGDVAYGGVAIQADGKVVAAGTTGCTRFRFTLTRYGPHGRLDTSFGGDGIIMTSFTTGPCPDCQEVAYDVAVQPDGKIVAAGARNGRFVMARYLAA